MILAKALRVALSPLVWRDVPVQVGDRTTTLAHLDVALAGGAGAASNVLGEDVLRAFAWWSVDFGRMQLELGPPLEKPSLAKVVP